MPQKGQTGQTGETRKTKPKSKSIDAYRDKRDFGRTPEPPPGRPSLRPGTPVFVVHRHEARRLHYDLRLEMDGVLKSWAVPRGFSYDPTVKRLAVRTEDHPLEYEHFHGVIPKDAYGAGTMTIWDHGNYRIEKADDKKHGVDQGKLELVLYGKKLRGEWHLVRTSSGKDEWLIFKARDRYVRKDEEPPPFFDLTAAVESSPSESVRLMEIGGTAKPFTDPAWVFEMKFQGRRATIFKRGDDVRLLSSTGEPLGAILSDLTTEIGEMRAENALLDGVLVVLDAARRPSAEALSARLKGETEEPVFFYAFDILHYDDWDVRPLPLLERKKILASVLPRLTHLLYVDHVEGRGEDFVDVTSAAGLPAVVAKEASVSYAAGPSSSWKEIPTPPQGRTDTQDLLEALKGAAPRKTKHKIKFSNLEKIYWPKEGYTKGDLIEYYEKVADLIVPYLHERPVHMLRYPDGIEGKAFYQKDAPEHMADWVTIEPIESESKGKAIRFVICNDRDTLLYMVNLGSIDLHPWLSRRGSLDSPDWAILDLDPDGSPFPHVVRVARSIGKVLRGIGLRPFLKTSGATGMHVYVPLQPGYTYEHAAHFCEGIARLVAQDHTDIATVERVVNRRGGKVYIDFLQNRRGQTVVPPYVARPVPGASVSTPLDWDELDSELHPSMFTIETALPRIQRLGDLFRGTLTDKQDLLPAIEALQKNYIKKK
ncbi:MAG: non-homologous end-joining DNA ligase [Vicinamibacteria bacterium]